MGAVALGIVLRVIVAVQGVPDLDASYYAAMGHSFVSGKEFLLPYGSQFRTEPGTGTIWDPVLAHHFAPMWPVVLGSAYAHAGFGLATTMVTSLLMSLLFVFVAYQATRNLFGTEKAWVVAAVVSVDFFLIQVTGLALSENLLAILYVATIWAILRSLKDTRYVVFGGLLAGAGYLTKSSVGYLFLLAGTIGFLWRFYYMRWGVFRNRYYVAAIAIFLAFVGVWALRNILAFGWPNWETSPYTNAALGYAVSRPEQFAPTMGAKVVFFFLYYATIGWFFGPSILREVRQWRDEGVSALLLAITLPAILGLIFATSFALYEVWQPLWLADNFRYVNVSFVPLLWLALRQESIPAEWRPRFRLTFFRRILSPSPRTLLVRGSLLALASVPFIVTSVPGITLFFERDTFRMFSFILLIGALFGPRGRGIRPVAILGLVAVLGLASVNTATTVYHWPEYAAGRYLAQVVTDGDTVAIPSEDIGHINPYFLHFYLAHRQIRFVEWDGSGGDFLLTRKSSSYANHELIAVLSPKGSLGLLDSAYYYWSTKILRTVGVSHEEGDAPSGELYLYRSTVQN